MKQTVAKDTLPGYHTLAVLNVGRRWTLSRVLDQATQRTVICKLLENAPARPEDAIALRREHAFLTRLQHRAIAQVVDFVDLGDRLALLLRDVGGVPLASQSASLPLETGTFLDMAFELTDALALIHSSGLAHLHITLDNIIWNSVTDTVVLADFSWAMDAAGTPPPARPEASAYMAPEQTGRLNRSVDYRADLYSLGAMFYHLLTGRPPFEATDPLDLFHCHVAKTPAAPHQINPNVPQPLSAIILRLMAKDPIKRYQSAFGLKADLEKCRRQWREQKRIIPFQIGEQDRRPALQIPKRLYGREWSSKKLVEALNRVAEGGHELLLLSGPSGIGKTALVQALLPVVEERNGWLLTGKFEPLRRDVPYAPIIQSFSGLFHRAEAKNDDALGAQLAQALGHEAGAITEVIPDLGDLLGAVPPSPGLDAAAAQNRFIYLFRKVMGAIATSLHPVVLFLDDLQWADLSSLKLLEALAGDPDLDHLLLIGAYRDNEAEALHPLHAIGKAAKARTLPVGEIHLEPLDVPAVVELLADTLSAPSDAVYPLARLLREETRGNPFFLSQYLDALEQFRLISFDHVSGVWCWDLAAIARRQIGNDLSDITLARIQELPSDSLRALQAASCIGSVFDLSILARTLGCPPQETMRALCPILDIGLIWPVENRDSSPKPATFRFAHDQIEQTAYSLLSDLSAKQLHLAVGKALQENGAGSDGPRLFDLVFQLNRAMPLLSETARIDLARQNLAAARAARAVVAVAPARNYLKAGLQALPGDAWETLYNLALAFHEESAELAAWAGEEADVFFHVENIEAHAKSPLDRVKALDILIQHHIARQNPAQALQVGREALRLLGHPLPDHITRHQVMVEMALTRLASFGKTEAQLTAQPAIHGPYRSAIGRILFLCAAPSYFSDPDLLAVVACRAVRLCLTTGRDAWAATSFAYWGVILASRLARYSEAAIFGRAAIRLAEESTDCPQAIFMVKAFLEPWHRSVTQTWPTLIDAHHQMMAKGDFLYAHLALNQVLIQRLFLGSPLDSLAEDAATFRASAEKVSQRTTIAFLKVFQQGIANLRGQAHPPTLFSGPFLDQTVDLADFIAAGNLRAVWQAYTLLAYINLLFGKMELARHYVELYRKLPVTSLGQVADLRHATIGSIIDYACWAWLSPQQRREAKRLAKTVAARLKGALHYNEDNFKALDLLLTAEAYRAAGHLAKARLVYEQAMDEARTTGHPHDEGLAAERNCYLALQMGQKSSAEALLQQAGQAYRRWGAAAKVRDVAEHLTDIFETPADSPASLPPEKSVLRSTATIDIETVIHASHALAEHIRLGDLLAKLMHLVLANGGATHGYLLLQTDGAWRIEAEASVEGGQCAVLQGEPLYELKPLATRALILQTIRRLEPDVQFNTGGAARPRSTLCLPLRNGNRLTGILYLENTLASGVFSRERVDLLNLLSTQMAIFIENARLYDDLAKLNGSLERQVEERTREAKEQSRLLEATLANMSEGLMAFDSEGRLVVHNGRAFEMLGLDPSLAAEEINSTTLTQLSGRQEGHGDSPAEIQSPGGRLVQLRRTAMTGGGEVLVCLDLSEERRHQSDLREAQTQAEQARQEAERASHAKTVFLASVGHDLRQPAQAIRLLTSALQVKLAGHPAIDIAFRMESALSALQRILDGLLDISRLEAGIVEVNAIDVDIPALLNEWVEMVRPQALDKGLGIALSLETSYLHADPALLYRVVGNLLDNAIKYTSQGGIMVSCHAAGEMVRIEVADSGPGVPVDRQNIIFDDFVQLDNEERSQTKGLGLGLAIARRLIRLMGGDIGVRANPTGGAIFWVDLPTSET